MAAMAYDFAYLRTKAWYRLLNVLTWLGLLAVLGLSAASSQGNPSINYCGVSELPLSSCTVIPGQPFTDLAMRN